MPSTRKPASPFRYFNSSPEVIRLVVMMYVKYPLSLRNVEDLLFAHAGQYQSMPSFTPSLRKDGLNHNRLVLLNNFRIRL